MTHPHSNETEAHWFHEILLPLLHEESSKNSVFVSWGWIHGRLSVCRELVDCLHQHNIKVFLISGGFRCIVEHVAAQLNIPRDHVYANRLKFYFNGKSEAPCVTLAEVSTCLNRTVRGFQGSTLVSMRVSPQPRAAGKERWSALWRSSMALRPWWWSEMELLTWRRALLLWVFSFSVHTHPPL